MKRSRGLRAASGRVAAVLIAAALVLAACDSAWAIVLENKSDHGLLARLSGRSTGDGTPVHEVVVVPPSSRITLLDQFSGGWSLARAEILAPTCEVMKVIDMTDGAPWVDGGTITIDPGLTIATHPGGNPGLGSEATTTSDCSATSRSRLPQGEAHLGPPTI